MASPWTGNWDFIAIKWSKSFCSKPGQLQGLPGGATIESTQVATPEQGSTDDLFQHLEIEFQMVTLAAGQWFAVTNSKHAASS